MVSAFRIFPSHLVSTEPWSTCVTNHHPLRTDQLQSFLNLAADLALRPIGIPSNPEGPRRGQQMLLSAPRCSSQELLLGFSIQSIHTILDVSRYQASMNEESIASHVYRLVILQQLTTDP